MKVEQVIKEVYDLHQRLIDVDGLSGEYDLHVNTNGDTWNVLFCGIMLVCSEDYDYEKTLKEQILKEMREVQRYLNLILPRGI